MEYEKIDLAEVINALEAKKAAIDNAITALKSVVSLGVGIGVSSSDGLPTAITPFAASGAMSEVPDGAFHGKTMPAAMKLFLELVHKKQTAREIADGLKKGGLESTSKFFDKIVYATLDRLRKSGEVIKIGTAWGLPAWYPALVRAGGINEDDSKRRRGRPRNISSSSKAKSEPGPIDRIDLFLRDTPGAHSSEEIRSRTGISNLRVTEMFLGKLLKRGSINKAADGKYTTKS